VLINYPAGMATEAFKNCGFRELNTLIWMKKDLPENLQAI